MAVKITVCKTMRGLRYQCSNMLLNQLPYICHLNLRQLILIARPTQPLVPMARKNDGIGKLSTSRGAMTRLLCAFWRLLQEPSHFTRLE